MSDETSRRTQRSVVGRGLEALSFSWLIVLAAGMAIAPWPVGPMPHLIEKPLMLIQGTLHRPIDIFDLFVHALPSVLLIAKTVHHFVTGTDSGN